MRFKRRVFDIIQIGSKKDILSNIFDYFIVITIFVNLTTAFASTFDEASKYSEQILLIELITSAIFLVEYALRVWTANYLYPDKGKVLSRITFIFSFFGIIDLLSFAPFFLPLFLPSGMVAFRIFRVVRIFRLFRINTQYDAFNVIADVIKEKMSQLISSMVIIVMLMLASSMMMYSLEHDAQPEIFANGFSGIWWSMSTLLTVGYGDVYPITMMGRLMAIVIAFLGVGLVSIPTGIISAGFVEQYTKVKNKDTVLDINEIRFAEHIIEAGHPWLNKKISEIEFSKDVAPTVIIRDDKQILPNKDVVLKKKDKLVVVVADDK